MEEVQTINNTDAKVVASLLGDSNNKVARYISGSRGNQFQSATCKDFFILLSNIQPLGVLISKPKTMSTFHEIFEKKKFGH